MSTLDTDLIKETTYALLENGDADATGTSLLTTMFTIADVRDALDKAQRRFLRDTAIIQKRTTIGGQAQISRYTLPANVVDVRRVAWKDADGGYRGLARADAWQADHGMSQWTSDYGTPFAYHDSTLPTRTVELVPTPNDVGQIHVLYSELTALLDGSGVALEIPDDFAWVVKWEALADLLAGEGEGNEPRRAAYCGQRYEQGVELVRLLTRGDV